MKLLMKILVVIVIVLLAFLFFLNRVNTEYEEGQQMENLVGARIGGGELSFNDYYILKQLLEKYTDFLDKKDFESAYKMFGASYRNYVPFDDYVKKVKDYESGDMVIKDINAITSTTFDFLTDESGDEVHYSVIINNENNTFAIYPYSFLDYNKPNCTVENKNVKFTLVDYVVNIDRCIFNFDIDKSSKNVTISEVRLITNLEDDIKLDDATIENNKMKIEMPVNYAFPKKLIIKCDVDGANVDFEYTF